MKHERLKKFCKLLIAAGLLLLPAVASAHEVYVLGPSQIAADNANSVDLLSALTAHNIQLLIGFSVGGAVSLLFALWLRTKRPVKKIGEAIDKASVIAPDVIRVAFGLSLVFSATHHAVFGPELPLSGFGHSDILYWLLLISGLFITAGLATRFFAVISVLIWIAVFANKGTYLLTYANYLGEALAVILLPSQWLSLDHLLSRGQEKGKRRTRVDVSERWAMPIARIFFGVALLYAAINVKLLHTAVSLDVVNEYHLTRYFPFDPLFVVLGATLTELLFAGLYILGLLQRVASVAFVTVIILSLLFFKEAVWPHYLLLGLAAGIFLHRPDRLSLDSRLSKL